MWFAGKDIVVSCRLGLLALMDDKGDRLLHHQESGLFSS